VFAGGVILVNAETVPKPPATDGRNASSGSWVKERQLNRFEGSEQEWGTTASTRWSDHSGHRWRVTFRGGRTSRDGSKWIAGKSLVAFFRRDDEGRSTLGEVFRGSFQTYDEKPRRRLWELMKSQGMQENQQVVFMSDGAENVPPGARVSASL